MLGRMTAYLAVPTTALALFAGFDLEACLAGMLGLAALGLTLVLHRRT
jgi:hypothetical protein